MDININCDLGEGLQNDAELMQHISSCNIACGGHAGTIQSIDKTIALAIENNVKIGAHPSFPDTENFGRKLLQISSDDLQKSIANQLKLFTDRLQLQNGKLHHVKAHGALYNASTKNREIAKCIIEAVKKIDNSVFLYVPFNSVIEEIAKENNISILYEVFIDRNYNDDGSLVSRTQDNAVIQDGESALKHLKQMVFKNQIKTISGRIISTKADTFCIHGDNKNAVELLKFINKNFKPTKTA